MSRYVSFESLLMTERAVARRGNWLLVSMAGQDPHRYGLEFDSKRVAKIARGSLIIHLREKRAAGELYTDTKYNSIVGSWFDQLLDGGYIKNKNEEEVPDGK